MCLSRVHFTSVVINGLEGRHLHTDIVKTDFHAAFMYCRLVADHVINTSVFENINHACKYNCMIVFHKLHDTVYRYVTTKLSF